MKEVLRTLAAVLLASFVALILIVAVELFSSVVHPLPEGFGETMEEMCQHVARYPHWVLAVVVPAWALTAFAGTWTAQRLGNSYSSAIVGLLLLAALAFNIAKLPYPTWFKMTCLLVIPIATVAGSWMVKRRRAAIAGGVH